MVMAQSLFKTLLAKNSNVQVSVLAPEWTRPLLQRMPEVSQTIGLPFGHGELAWGKRREIAKEILKLNFDQAIVLPGSLKSGLIPFWAKIPKRTGFRGEMRYGLLNDIRLLDKEKLSRTVQRFVALGLPAANPLPNEIPNPRLKVKPAEVEKALNRLEIKKIDQPILALCPGAEYGPAKRWPASHFAELAQSQIEKGWQVWLFGSDKDVSITQTINEKTDAQCLDLAGSTTLPEAVDLMSLAEVVVSNDSGLMHVAAALDKKVIALYGSSSPDFTPPLHADAEIMSLNLECSPCFKRECPLGHLNCLNNLSPESVSQKISDHN